ncbi:uncharacterized protein LOC119583322 [Penaeus monodon]|uniref:uncharacterized protein LOC119583322 n=1 Tax=Penaeus monodon TaxID=6687 RepID=UPI0018A75AA3|nr:uncharacterized protein LOC119583322 [Penaeus monodon]
MEDNASQFSPEAVIAFKRNSYMDDVLKSEMSVSQGSNLAYDLRLLAACGGFHLTQFASSSTSVVKDQPMTRRGILSIVASVFDPLGLADPFILTVKQLIQGMCKDGLSWDHPIGEPRSLQWKQWPDELQRLVNFRVQRCFIPPDFGRILSYQLHHFSDASNAGYDMQELLSVNSQVYTHGDMLTPRIIQHGVHIDEFLKRKDWVNGPPFLGESEDHWPNLPADVVSNKLDVDDAEVKGNTVAIFTAAKEPGEFDLLFERFSNWTKLQRVMAWVLRFASKLKQVTSTSKSCCIVSGDVMSVPPLDLVDLEHSEKVILKIVQYSCFADELKLLAESKAHSGRNYVLSHLRQRYWILGAGPFLKKITSTCTVCRRLAPQPLMQLISDLPADILSPNKPLFTHSGVDCLGPFMVKRSCSDVKHYRVIFHLSDILSCPFGSCGDIKYILFHYGPPQVFNPPAASHFGGVWERQIRSVRRILLALLRQQKLTREQCCQIGGIFPSFGKIMIAAAERIFSAINNMKTKQRNSLSTKTLVALFHYRRYLKEDFCFSFPVSNALLQRMTSDMYYDSDTAREGLKTLMCEVEAILNCRPLTKSSEDPQDAEPITPNHLFTLKGPLAPPGKFLKEDLYCKRRWRQVHHRNISVGDVVLVVDEHVPRCSWPMGKVIDVVRGKDGRVRSVRVKTQLGEYDRPISKMCKLLEKESSGKQ